MAIIKHKNAVTKMLPEPTLILTLPSIHDGTTLDCRIYHPASLTANPSSPQWRRYGVILAHPYAPLGGSFDDPILEVVATALLRSGFLVAMFNFRFDFDLTPNNDCHSS